MARGYDETEVKFRLIKLLHSSKSGISGVEISEKLKINRVTMSKYLNKFAAVCTKIRINTIFYQIVSRFFSTINYM